MRVKMAVETVSVQSVRPQQYDGDKELFIFGVVWNRVQFQNQLMENFDKI